MPYTGGANYVFMRVYAGAYTTYNQSQPRPSLWGEKMKQERDERAASQPKPLRLRPPTRWYIFDFAMSWFSKRGRDSCHSYKGKKSSRLRCNQGVKGAVNATLCVG